MDICSQIDMKNGIPMFLIQNILVSDRILEEDFACNLNACKGNCCQEGDYGAPVNLDEVKIIEENLEYYKKYMDEESIHILKNKGAFDHFSETKFRGIRLKEDGACIFMTRSIYGIAQCGIELAHTHEKIDYLKPISCHLYPIRITKNELSGFEAINYDEWDICNPACLHGKDLKLPVFKFLKDPIIRKYGLDFYQELEAAHTNYKAT
jgi:hypothetical protein